MCILAIAWRTDPAWPLVIAANRDERHDRASAPLRRWVGEGADGAETILGGRDLVAGGGWLALSPAGRLAAVTNRAGEGAPPPGAPSRGRLVWDLAAGMSAGDLTRFAPCNLLHVAQGEAWLLTNRGHSPGRLAPGVHAVSNGATDDDWPKMRALRGHVAAWLDRATDRTDELFAALAEEVPQRSRHAGRSSCATPSGAPAARR